MDIAPIESWLSHCPNPSLQEIIACVGYPVAGNPTQFVMERAFAAANVDSRCLTVDVEPSRLESAIRGWIPWVSSGAVVAAPHQLACRSFLMSESPECSKLGEVDLIHRESSGFFGATQPTVRYATSSHRKVPWSISVRSF